MWIIGDVHGRFNDYIDIIQAYSMEKSIQVGDMGVGFRYPIVGETDWAKAFNFVGLEHKFFRGNHDSPYECWKSPNHLGDYGYLPNEGIYYVGGGFSIDRQYRIEGVDWWSEEELTAGKQLHVLKEYKDYKPRIVLSHECPTVFKPHCLPNITSYIQSGTERLLQALYEEHQPDIWVCGHYHIGVSKKLGKTQFVCLGGLGLTRKENCVIDLG